MQIADTVMMIEPVAFGFNTQTESSNAFQLNCHCDNAQSLALSEALSYIQLLQSNGINVVHVKDTKTPPTPDSVFPNNWFSTHGDGTLVLYPMCAPNRRQERKQIFLDAIEKHFHPKHILDLTHYENEGLFLEGTGSLVLDRVNKVAFACRSVRTSKTVLNDFCQAMGYQSVVFDATDDHGQPIYHSNVMLSITTDYAIICADTIRNKTEQKAVIGALTDCGKKVISISIQQMMSYAGNVLELRSQSGKRYISLSQTAYHSFTEAQRDMLRTECDFLCPDLEIIEKIGGGSARCMVAEIFHSQTKENIH